MTFSSALCWLPIYVFPYFSTVSFVFFPNYFSKLCIKLIAIINLKKKKKKSRPWELQVQFYLRQNEGCSLGHRTSGSSEKLHQIGRRGGQYICDFGEGETHAIKHIFFQKVPANLVKLLLVTRNSCYDERLESQQQMIPPR